MGPMPIGLTLSFWLLKSIRGCSHLVNDSIIAEDLMDANILELSSES
jgi:hypothetical protein